MLCCADMIADSIEQFYCADTNLHQRKSFLEQIVSFINNNPLISDFLISNNQPSQESNALKVSISITASQFPYRILQMIPF